MTQAQDEELADAKAEIERLRAYIRVLIDNDKAAAQLTEAAAFLDALAERIIGSWGTTHEREQEAADCRALAAKLRK